jgi:hypothetical protein
MEGMRKWKGPGTDSKIYKWLLGLIHVCEQIGKEIKKGKLTKGSL